MAAVQSYRVLPGPDADRLRFLDRETYEPVVVAVGETETEAADLQPGYLVEATLDWSTPDPTVESLSVQRRTQYTFADRIDPVFEVAQETWREARATGDGMNSRVTRNTDGDVNGVVYVFAESEQGDRFEEFRSGRRPLEPLVEKVNDREPRSPADSRTEFGDSEGHSPSDSRTEFGDSEGVAPREVFVLRPVGGEYVVVTIAIQKGGQFARTIRDTYDC